MGLRRTPRTAGSASLATLAALAVCTAVAPAALADEGEHGAPTSPTVAADTADTAGAVSATRSVRTVIPLPRVTVSRVCGACDDIVTVDPAWLAQWGDKVEIFPNSLTFQGGADAETAKPAGMIRNEFRSTYRWAGSRGTEWASWLLYPGTVKPIVDQNVACPIQAEAPRLVQTVRCGAQNDRVAFADDASAQEWRMTGRSWTGNTLTVSLRVRRGYVGPGGASDVEQDFTDTGSCADG